MVLLAHGERRDRTRQRVQRRLVFQACVMAVGGESRSGRE